MDAAPEDCSIPFTDIGFNVVHGWIQDDAKKAVAVAFRNRWRRHRVQPQSLKPEIQVGGDMLEVSAEFLTWVSKVPPQI